jgi:hypothetical protein
MLVQEAPLVDSQDSQKVVLPVVSLVRVVMPAGKTVQV